MEWKDYALIAAIILIVGGPLAVHMHHRGKGRLEKRPQETDGIIDDGRRLGETIAAYGGKTVAEGATAIKLGALKFHARNENKKQQKVGGA